MVLVGLGSLCWLVCCVCYCCKRMKATATQGSERSRESSVWIPSFRFNTLLSTLLWILTYNWATNYPTCTSSRSRPSAPAMEDGSDYENTRHQDSFNDYSDYDGMYERR